MAIKDEKKPVNVDEKTNDEKEKIESVLQPVVTPTPEPLSEGTPATANVAMEETMPFGSVVEEVVDTAKTPENSKSLQNEENEEENRVQLVPAPCKPQQSEEKSEEQSVQPEPVPCV